MLRNSAMFKILGFAIIGMVLFAVYKLTDTRPAGHQTTWILGLSIVGFFGALVGLIYHTLTLKSENHEGGNGEKTRERIPFVSDHSFETTREGGLVYFDYKSLSKSRLVVMLVIFHIALFGGCVRYIDAPEMFWLYTPISIAVLLLTTRPAHRTITIKPGDYIDGEYGRVGVNYIFSITPEERYVYVISKDQNKVKLTSRLKTPTLAKNLAETLRSNLR
mgnify:CR=1 FL=1